MEENKRDVGLHNVKNLFTWGDFKDWIIFFMIVMLLLMAYLYKAETQICREYVVQYEAEWNALHNGTYLNSDKDNKTMYETIPADIFNEDG